MLLSWKSMKLPLRQVFRAVSPVPISMTGITRETKAHSTSNSSTRKTVKTMKKTLFMLGLMFTALTLSNCTKTEEQDVVPGKPNENAFELFATPTRTTTDGMSTSWAAADEINVFHAVAGTEIYVHDTPYDSASGGGTPFTIAAEDLETGRFTGNLAEALDGATEYDWYLFYPYSSYIRTPANTNSGYTAIGQQVSSKQVQTGNDNMSHASGANCPLYGVAKNIPGSQTPDIVMHHLTSILEVVVTNAIGEEITVNEVSIKTANEKIIGTYYVNFAVDPVVYTPSGDKYVDNYAALTVNEGAPIAAGSSAKFYIAIKPFVSAAGESLTLRVSTDKGICEKSLELNEGTQFVAGNIKPLKFAFDSAQTNTSDWVLVTDISEIVAGEYVIVAKTDTNTGLLPSITTSSAPVYNTSILIDEENNKIVSTVTDEMKWTFSGSTAAMTITNYEGKVLYMTNTNNGVRVGTNSTFQGWVIAAHSDGVANTFSFTSSEPSRFLGVYDNQDWRCYTTIDATNFTNGKGSSKIYLYKSVSNLPALDAPTGLSVSNDVVSWNAVANAGSYTVSVGTLSETVSETSYTYTGAAGVYNVSVVANPADAASYLPSSAAILNDIKFGKPALESPVVTIDETTLDGFTASWPAVANATGYMVDVTSDAEGINSVGSVAETPGDPYSITVTGLAEATEYYLHVYAAADGVEYSDSPIVVTRVVTTSSTAQQYTDILVASKFNATSTTYAGFSGVTFTSSAVYAGNNAMTKTGGIQLRSSKSNSGIVTTVSGGKAIKVVVTWESGTASGRTLDIYGSDTPYASATQLYSSTTQGTLLGSIVCGTSTELVIEGNYPYIAMRSKEDAMYLTQIEITWEK